MASAQSTFAQSQSLFLFQFFEAIIILLFSSRFKSHIDDRCPFWATFSRWPICVAHKVTPCRCRNDIRRGAVRIEGVHESQSTNSWSWIFNNFVLSLVCCFLSDVRESVHRRRGTRQKKKDRKNNKCECAATWAHLSRESRHLRPFFPWFCLLILITCCFLCHS